MTSETPASPYVADPANPTSEELDAAIQRSLAAGTLIDAGDWMARMAAELGEDCSECGALIPRGEPSEISDSHQATCSLHPANTVSPF